MTRPNSPILSAEDYEFELGKLVTVKEGSDVTVVASGTQTPRAYEALDTLAAEGIDVNLVHVPTIKPLDVAGVVAAAEKTGPVVTTEEHIIVGGLGGAIAEALAENSSLPMKLHGPQDVFGESGPNDELLDKYGISAAHIASTVTEFVHSNT